MEAVLEEAGSDLAWAEGYVAGYAMQPPGDNPYLNEAEFSEAWGDGWRGGMDGVWVVRIIVNRERRASPYFMG